jgi:hypothetical protein
MQHSMRMIFPLKKKKEFLFTLSCFFFFFDSRFDERRSLKLPPIGFDTYRINIFILKKRIDF